ncbi:MAG: hypothetical protein QXF56_01025 [Candidatus Micrarchaeia archaeon]
MGVLQSLQLLFKKAVSITGIKTERGVLARIEIQLAPYMDVMRSELNASEWAVLVALSSCVGFLILLLPLYSTTGSPELTLIFSLLGAIFIGYIVMTIPMLLSYMKVEGMEKAMPLFLSHLTAIYSERKNMRDALLSVMSLDYGKLSPELREAVSKFEVSGNPKTAFRRLRETIKSRKINRAFDLITNSIETGVDVSESLTLLTSNITSDFDAESERRSRVDLSTWMIFLSSAFFYPFFAGMGYNVILLLESLMGAPLYSELEKQFLLFSLITYMMLANVLDAMFIGEVRYGSVRRGLMMVFPVMFLVASVVFVVSMRFAGAFVG